MILIFSRSPQLLSHLWRHFSLGPLTHKTVSLLLPQTWSVVTDYTDGCSRLSEMFTHARLHGHTMDGKGSNLCSPFYRWETKCLDKLSPAQRNKSKTWEAQTHTQVLWLQISALSTEKGQQKPYSWWLVGMKKHTIFPSLWVSRLEHH